MKLRLLITERGGYEQDDLHRLSESFNVFTEAPESQADVTRLIQKHQPDVLVVGLGFSIGLAEISAATKLSLVASPTTGTDHLDAVCLRERGIQLMTLRDLADELGEVSSTAELAWGLLLALARGLINASVSVNQGEWEREKFLGTQLRGKTLGVVGLGRLGTYVARYGMAFDMPVLAVDPEPSLNSEKIEFCSLSELVHRADVISIHIPLTPKTAELFDQSVLEKTKTGVLIINTSRGEVIDELALANLVRKGHIGGYATDVIAGDAAWGGTVKPNAITPLISEGLNVIVTPHIGGYSHDAVRHTRQLIVEFLLKYPSKIRS